MSAGELAERAGRALMRGVDRLSHGAEDDVERFEALVDDDARTRPILIAPSLASPEATEVLQRDDWQAQRSDLLARADAIADGGLTLFGHYNIRLQRPEDWNADLVHDRSAGTTPSRGLDYRDFGAVGDCKIVWEPSRHHQFVVLGRAYRVTGRPSLRAGPWQRCCGRGSKAAPSGSG
jgi:hypothetical protein